MKQDIRDKQYNTKLNETIWDMLRQQQTPRDILRHDHRTTGCPLQPFVHGQFLHYLGGATTPK